MSDDFETREQLLKAALEANRSERRKVESNPTLRAKNILEASVIVREMNALATERCAAKEAADKAAREVRNDG